MQLFPQAQPFRQILQHFPLSTGVGAELTSAPTGVANAYPVPAPMNNPRTSSNEYIQDGIGISYALFAFRAPVPQGQVRGARVQYGCS